MLKIYLQSFCKWNKGFKNIYKICTKQLQCFHKYLQRCGTCKQLTWTEKPEKGKVNEYESFYSTETLKKLCKMVSTNKKRIQKNGKA